jgi:hypothetical protein
MYGNPINFSTFVTKVGRGEITEGTFYAHTKVIGATALHRLTLPVKNPDAFGGEWVEIHTSRGVTDYSHPTVWVFADFWPAWVYYQKLRQLRLGA